jgi:hypothetical protein
MTVVFEFLYKVEGSSTHPIHLHCLSFQGNYGSIGQEMIKAEKRIKIFCKEVEMQLTFRK